MKLKYYIKNTDEVLLANCLHDLALHFNISLSGLKYRIKNKLMAVEKCDKNLYDLSKVCKYDINKFGVVIVDITDKTDTIQNIDSNNIHNEKLLYSQDTELL